MDFYFADLRKSDYDILMENVALGDVNVLNSFANNKQFITQNIHAFREFLLDSGAFTFLNSGKKLKSWDEYIEQYADFIVRHGVSRYFELDIDSIVGLPEVERMRRKLEKLTRTQCIPVWHKSRGWEKFVEMCKEYSYVAIGGIVTKEIKQAEYRYFPKFIRTAHENGAKIHGLGFTKFDYLKIMHFDSVDSTSYNEGGKYGTIRLFDGENMRKFSDKSRRILSWQKSDRHNIPQWISFMEYARDNL